MELLDSSFLGPILVLVNQYFSIIDDYHALWFCFIFCTFDLISYSVKVCSVICEHLNIRCFKVDAPLPGVGSVSRTVVRDRGSYSDRRHVGDVAKSTPHNVAKALNCYSNMSYANSNRLQRT